MSYSNTLLQKSYLRCRSFPTLLIFSSLVFHTDGSVSLISGVPSLLLRMLPARSTVYPFDPHRIACFGDGAITIWDARCLPQPLLTFTEKDASADGAQNRSNSTFTTIEFSSTRRGTLAVLERDSTYVRFWDLQQAQVADSFPSGEHSRDSSHSNTITRRSWTNLPWSTSTPAGRESIVGEPREPLSTLVLADTRKSMYLPFLPCMITLRHFWDSQKLQPHACFIRASSQPSNASINVQCYGGQQ